MALRLGSINDLPPHLRAQALAQTTAQPLTPAQRIIAGKDRMTTAQRIAAADSVVRHVLDNHGGAAKKREGGKMGAKRTVIDGIPFPSKLEANRYIELKALRAAGKVRVFHRQVTFDLGGTEELGRVTYRVDFLVVWDDGRVTYEDAKGIETENFRNKRKLVKAQWGVDIELVKRPERKHR